MKANIYRMIEEEFRKKSLELVISILEKVKINLVDLDKANSFFPGGHNGPHYALETPLRNSAHLALSFSIIGSIKKNKDFLAISNKLFNWIINSENIHFNSGLVLRQKKGTDSCNGVIGFAWMIESLYIGSQLLNRSDLEQKAREIYSLNNLGINYPYWFAFDKLTKKRRIDYTLDHQAWMASSACLIGDLEKVNEFLNLCNKYAFKINIDGRIRDLLYLRNLKGLFLSFKFYLKRITAKKWVTDIENAYHHYSLFPFARIHKFFPNHEFFRSQKFLRSLKFLNERNIKNYGKNNYFLHYNNPYLEIPIVKSTFNKEVNISWDYLYDGLCEFKIFIEGNSKKDSIFNCDFHTLISRIYEISIYYLKEKDL